MISLVLLVTTIGWLIRNIHNTQTDDALDEALEEPGSL